MTAASVDTRALKDSAAEHLKNSRFDEAAELLQKLVEVEPDEMQHRLRLGDSYRRLNETKKAIEQYERAGHHFADEGQFIKAIAAFKIVLEMDPGNAAARDQLSTMNRRRHSQPLPSNSALSRRQKVLASAIKEVEPIGLSGEDALLPGKIPSGVIPDYGKELVFDEEAEKFSTGNRTKYVIVPPPPPAAVEAVSAQADAAPIERLPTDAIVGTAVGPRPYRPIADLLGSDLEEEIELLSHLENQPLEQPLDEGGITGEIEAAVGAIAPVAQTRRRLPTRVPLFDDLPHEALVELVNRLSHLRYRAGDHILKEGERGRSFFVIVDGRVRIWKTLSDGSEMELATLEEGAFFGEMATLSGGPRTANASAEMDTELLELTDSVLHDLTSKYPNVVQSLKNFYRRRLLENVMAISPLFKDFDPSERPHIVEKFKLRQAAPGEMLIKQGAPSDGLYVVLHGSVDVVAKDVPLAKLKEGDIFGEMSLLKREPATATVTSSGNSILLRLSKEKFQELVVTHPQILALVSELTEQRAAETRAALERHSISSFV